MDKSLLVLFASSSLTDEVVQWISNLSGWDILLYSMVALLFFAVAIGVFGGVIWGVAKVVSAWVTGTLGAVAKVVSWILMGLVSAITSFFSILGLAKLFSFVILLLISLFEPSSYSPPDPTERPVVLPEKPKEPPKVLEVKKDIPETKGKKTTKRKRLVPYSGDGLLSVRAFKSEKQQAVLPLYLDGVRYGKTPMKKESTKAGIRYVAVKTKSGIIEVPALVEEGKLTRIRIPLYLDSISCEESPNCSAGKSETITFMPILFSFGRLNLTAKARDQLLEIGECIKKAKCLRIDVHGHSHMREGDPESSYPEGYFLALSKKRAETVARYLKNLGIEKSLFRINYWEDAFPPVCKPASPVEIDYKRRAVVQCVR